MNAKAKRSLTIQEIVDVTREKSLNAAREILYKQIGAIVEVSGTVEKKIVRHEHLKLLIQPKDIAFSVFAEFTDEKEAENVINSKIRKGSKVELSGQFLASGTSAANLNYCRLKGEK